jgi:hypothetical protein
LASFFAAPRRDPCCHGGIFAPLLGRVIFCVEGNAYITINKQVYVVSGDGLLMPSKKNQPAPDLRYFKQGGK